MSGLDELGNRIDSIRTYTPMPQLIEGAQTALALMKENVPVKTGELQEDLQMIVGDNVVIIFSPTFYSAFVDIGTKFMAARPFFRNAIQDTFPEAGAIMTAALRERFMGAKGPGDIPAGIMTYTGLSKTFPGRKPQTVIYYPEK